METIIVSACLLGDKCRYDGKDNYNEKVKFLREHFNIVPVCPEVLGGMSIPRTPSEIKNNVVLNKNGKDVTHCFKKGADSVLNVVKYLHIKKAVLVDHSPSCGVNQIYDGNFNNKLIDGEGYTTRELKRIGVECFTIDEAEKLIEPTIKETFAIKEAEQKKREEEKAAKIAKNTEYSKLNNKKPANKDYRYYHKKIKKHIKHD